MTVIVVMMRTADVDDQDGDTENDGDEADNAHG